MRRNFIEPKLAVATFVTENIITTSGTVSQADKISALKDKALESNYMQHVEAVNIIDFSL